MRAVVLVTFTDCENKWRSLVASGYEVHTIQYDNRPHDRHGEIVEEARSMKPDFIVHIGAVEKYHVRPVPQPHIYRALREIAPIIHMCNDAGDPPWWDMLEVYEREDCFTVQVSIDGSVDNPIARFNNGMLELTPIDNRVFNPLPWNKRDINMSMVGGKGHNRAGEIDALIGDGSLNFFQGPDGRTYEQMADIMCRSRVTYNLGLTGSGQRLHVKGRVVEAGFAGSALFDKRGSPTLHWLIPGVEYFEYDNAADVASMLRELPDSQLNASAVALSMRMHREHHPKLFWQRVLTKAGVNHVQS